jgi:Excalibur calcium-binding domain
MKKYAIAAMLIAVLCVTALVPSASGVTGDRDCGDFGSWKAAQKFYKKNGGPRYDPHRLDADRDGIACEELRY